MIALTATATTMSYYVIGERLSLYSSILISASPVRNNIVYVVTPKIDIEHFCTTLATELKLQRCKYPNFRTYGDCIQVYSSLSKKKGHKYLNLSVYPN